MKCDKLFYKRPPQLIKFPNGKFYKSSPAYSLRIGNKIMFNDLLKLGIAPKKSLSLKMPKIPCYYFPEFLRGYYDGDGCLTLSRPASHRAYRATVVFTSGSKHFLTNLSEIISIFTTTPQRKLYQQKNWFYLTYFKAVSLKILKLMYHRTEKNKLYLDRKYERYLTLLQAEKTRLET